MKHHKIIISALFLSCHLVQGENISEAPKKLVSSVKNGHLVKLQDLPSMTCESHYQAAMAAYEKQGYKEAVKHFQVVKVNFPTESSGADAAYYLGVCYYMLDDLAMANESFSDYLKMFMTPKYFQQAIEYKFSIAERLKDGERRRVVKGLPKVFTGKALAVEIYDEVIAALPSHEYAAQALYAKGMLLKEMKEFRESVETFQTLIKRFPRHELAPESYLAVTKVFLDQCRYEFQNPDLITFAEINLRKFTSDFPRESRISEMKADVDQIKEVYAQGLYETGQYYERVEKWNASLFCYRNAKEKFPDTEVAKKCDERISLLDAKLRRFAADPRDPRFRNMRVKNISGRKTT